MGDSQLCSLQQLLQHAWIAQPFCNALKDEMVTSVSACNFNKWQ